MEGATGGGGGLGGAAPTSAAGASVLSAKGQGEDGVGRPCPGAAFGVTAEETVS